MKPRSSMLPCGGRTAEVAGEYLSKGSPVLIEGRLKLDSWETDGQKRSKLKVIGERMRMLGGRGGGGGSGGGSGRPQSADENEYNQPASVAASESMGPSQGVSEPGEDIPF